MQKIKTIAFDADDTLWVNEPYFREAELHFCEILSTHLPNQDYEKVLFEMEMKNLPLYGYGIKGFMLSMIETVLSVTNDQFALKAIESALNLGKELIHKPIEMLDGVEEVLKALSGKYRLVVATKGDLLDQERKLKKSGIEHYFHHIEIMSDKTEADYLKLIKHLDCQPDEFLMIGNSLKSDILPVLNIGSKAVHVPFHTTWAHETIDFQIENENFGDIKSIIEILEIL